MNAGFGGLLKSLRTSRRVSQMQLSFDAEVSTRHLSFLETGKAHPSREMVLVLGSALDLPLRDRNLLLESAGFTAAYKETSLAAPEMAELLHAMQIIIRGHDPFPAMVMDRRWNIIMGNGGFAAAHALFTQQQFEPYVMLPEPRPNLVTALADSYRPFIRNWDRVVLDVLPRVEREAQGNVEILSLCNELWRRSGLQKDRDFKARAALVLPVEIALGDQTARLFSTITTLGTPQDVTTQELRIEVFHPADDASRRLLAPLLTTGA
ncbi:MAG: transcriptional regulator [Archangium gephyra]|uniref:Transcriptional regulator n=1 Tax=Archangium gephyra TaxID=48 RepID=A0A2W5T4R9_9BACT|nr:MAG: transcriptional regulator [Archangium gephyra]